RQPLVAGVERHDRVELEQPAAVAEVCANVVCAKLGVGSECSTREFVTLPHTAFYAEPDRRLA
ncbi:MAG: hypothetical protein ACXVWF_10185, partial [Actinomycetota bacterium]